MSVKPTDPGQRPAATSIMARIQSSRLWKVGRVLVSATLLGVLLWRIDLHTAFAMVRDARPDLLLLALLLLTLARYVAGYRWYLLLHGKHVAVTARRIIDLAMTSAFLGYFLPGTGSEVLRFYGLSRATTDPALVLASLLVERVTALFLLLAIVLIGLVLFPLPLPEQLTMGAALGLIGLVLGSLVIMHPALRALTGRLLRGRWLSVVRTKLDKVYHCLDAYRDQPGVILVTLIIGLGFQLLRILPVAIAAAAFGLSVPFGYFLIIVPTILLLILMPISIGGLGVREAGYVYFFGLLGVSPEAAFTLSLMIYVLNLVSVAPGAWILARRGFHT